MIQGAVEACAGSAVAVLVEDVPSGIYDVVKGVSDYDAMCWIAECQRPARSMILSDKTCRSERSSLNSTTRSGDVEFCVATRLPPLR